MNFSQAKEHFKNAIKIECLIRGTVQEVVPGTVQKGMVSKNFVMETTSGVFACVVDVYDRKVAKIVEYKAK